MDSLHWTMTSDDPPRRQPLTFLPNPPQMGTHNPPVAIPTQPGIMQLLGKGDGLAHQTFGGMADGKEVLCEKEGELACFVWGEVSVFNARSWR